MFETDTIIAAATPRGVGALAILRISGADAHTLFAQMVQDTAKAERALPFKMHLYTILDSNGQPIDEVTALRFNDPKSFTGENMVEITCHGGSIIVERLVERAIELGARYADRGEFSRRAFLNGKMDLKKAESIHQLIHADSLAAHKTAVKHYLGEDRHFFDGLSNQLRQLLVWLETEIEFSETDDVGSEEAFREKITTLLTTMQSSLTAELHKRALLKQIDQGVSVALIGRANAGKSSVLNMLVGYDRAIINEQAGTTRDLITESVRLGGVKVRFVDTAGLNETTNEIELEGIKRTKAALQECEIVCWIVDGNAPMPIEDLKLLPTDKPQLLLINKSDLEEEKSIGAFTQNHSIEKMHLCAKEETGKELLLHRLSEILTETFSDMSYETAIGSDREEGVIRRLLAEIEEIDLALTWDMIAASLHGLLGYFEEIYGKISPEDIMNQVFDQFCIGK